MLGSIYHSFVNHLSIPGLNPNRDIRLNCCIESSTRCTFRVHQAKTLLRPKSKTLPSLYASPEEEVCRDAPSMLHLCLCLLSTTTLSPTRASADECSPSQSYHAKSSVTLEPYRLWFSQSKIIGLRQDFIATSLWRNRTLEQSSFATVSMSPVLVRFGSPASDQSRLHPPRSFRATKLH